MDSYLILDGVALWVLLACVVVVLIGIICLGTGYIAELRENNRLKLENELLNRELEAGKYSKYKATFKVPEVR